MNKLLNLAPVKQKSQDRNHSAAQSVWWMWSTRAWLKAVGVVSDSYGSWLCPVLMKMMPEEIALEFRRQLKEDEVLSVTKLMDFLPKEVESRERPVNLSQRQSSATAERQREKKVWRKKKLYSNFSFLSRWCTRRLSLFVLQQTSHKSRECSVEAMRDKLRRLGRCYVYLDSRHIAHNCRAQGILCESYGQRHFKSVCPQLVPHKENETSQNVDILDALVSISPVQSNP